MTTRVSRKFSRYCESFDNFIRIEAGGSHGRAVFLVNGNEEFVIVPYGSKVSDCSYRNIRSRIKAQQWGGPPVSAANFTVTNSFDPPDDEYYAARERRAFVQRNPDLYDAIECSFSLTQSPATTHSIVSSTTSQTQSTTTTHRGSSSMTGRLSLGSSATGSLRSQPSSRCEQGVNQTKRCT